MKESLRFLLPARYGELESVHRQSLARLLVEGTRRRRSGVGALSAYATLLRPVASRWRRRAARQLALLQRDGWQIEGRDLLGDLLAGRAKRISSVEIISLAVEIWSSPENYLALGQALLTEGSACQARAVYSFLLQDLHCFEYEGPALRWRVREGLAAAWEALGKDRVASGCLAAGLDDPESGAGPLIAAFFLAIELGRGQEVRHLAQRIDARFRGRSKHFDACVCSLVARVILLRPGQWVPPLTSSKAFGELVQSKRRSGQICRRLVGLNEDVL